MGTPQNKFNKRNARTTITGKINFNLLRGSFSTVPEKKESYSAQVCAFSSNDFDSMNICLSK
jgi:hypothetical protein